MKNEKKYYLGLDVGTDSVGYAVTTPEYELLKFHGKPAWGVTVFDEAALNSDRRKYRTARRRLNRRKQRVILLQELFAKEIEKADPVFLFASAKAGRSVRMRKTRILCLRTRDIRMWIITLRIPPFTI